MNKGNLGTDQLAVINKYSNTVYRLAYSLVKNPHDAEDIHQEVFVKYISKQPFFENAEHEKAWFLRVTINQCKNLWKSAWKQRVIKSLDYDFEEEEASVGNEEWIIHVVKQLPVKYRVVIHLFYYEELSVEEMAQVLKEKPSTVRTQLTRARKKLRELLKEDMDVS